MNAGSRSSPSVCRASSIARPAWRITWMLPGSVISSKNQPQLVCISIACRSISRSAKIRRRSSGARSRGACREKNASTASSDHRLRMRATASSRASRGSWTRRSSASADLGARVSLTMSTASLSGSRQACDHPGCAPLWHPHSRRQRSTPWVQLQDVLSWMTTSCVGGWAARYSP